MIRDVPHLHLRLCHEFYVLSCFPNVLWMEPPMAPLALKCFPIMPLLDSGPPTISPIEPMEPFAWNWRPMAPSLLKAGVPEPVVFSPAGSCDNH
jgi:hypothetical protein